MRNEIRTFIAIKINPDQKLLDQFRTFKKLFNAERINWVAEDNFHLTLRFIGNTTREQLYGLVDRLEEVANDTSKFSFKIQGAGYFKSKGNPRVLFVRITEEEAMSQLAGKVEEIVTSIGFLPELKPFRPHLTLGRIKFLENRNRFMSVIDELPDKEYQQVEVSEFILYQSILRPEGPVYKPIQTFELQ
ncbi:RNA 2',3'-cyclic phosphodiesterase [Maribellus sediminis]|uniref:RNA 2',3'-cyclic phosphodiesterase n=1 Tax=Maribellus sediminis TaxID=2696285 RepID=UPI001F0CE997|nr:RNA 2',3'-cyclic phosphodiesterase [Maribellus sediminis]